jgi:hypothetical protein
MPVLGAVIQIPLNDWILFSNDTTSYQQHFQTFYIIISWPFKNEGRKERPTLLQYMYRHPHAPRTTRPAPYSADARSVILFVHSFQIHVRNVPRVSFESCITPGIAPISAVAGYNWYQQDELMIRDQFSTIVVTTAVSAPSSLII